MGNTDKMHRSVNFLAVLFFALLLFLAPSAKAQGTFTAASCSQSDVNAVINGPTHKAVNGDTIKIPAGSCTWTSGITVPIGIGITIVGAGQGVTIITDQLSSGSLFTMSPIYGSATSRISSMTLQPFLPRNGYGQPIGVTGTCTVSGCPNLRIDHITAPSSWAGIGISDDTFAVVNNMFGVADHNTVGDVQPASNGLVLINVGHGAWKGIGGWGDNSWASPDTFGTNQAFYLENNTFNYAVGTDTDTYVAGGGGGRYVCRFNVFNNLSNDGACANHGTDTGGRLRGARQIEDYNNTGTATQGRSTLFGSRSATAIIFGNSFGSSGSGFLKSLANLDAQRRWRPDSPWGACDGSKAWDTNDGTTYFSGTIGSVSTGTNTYTITDSGSPSWTANRWVSNGSPYSLHDITVNGGAEIIANTSNSITVSVPDQTHGTLPNVGDSYQILRSTACLDQPGRGAGALVTSTDIANGTNPFLVSTGNPGPVNQAFDPWYEFADTVTATGYGGTIGSSSLSIIANRDFYAESPNQAAQTSPTSPFNGTGGTGHGTLANRPTSCTMGVGYWATDQGNWNQSGSGAQGELFVCTATNTWTLRYTPYTYPHPLIAGGTTGSGGNSLNPPTALAASVQ